MDYTHEVGNEVRSISGTYSLEKEDIIEVKGKEILYAVGTALLDTSCCGPWGCRYVLVPGYLKQWKYRTNEKGLPVSNVEPIPDEDMRLHLKNLLLKKENATQVQFW